MFLECAYSLPVERGGALVPYEAVVQELQDHTITYSNSLGHPPLNLTFSVSLSLSLSLSL